MRLDRLSYSRLDALWSRIIDKKYDYSKGYINRDLKDRLTDMQRRVRDAVDLKKILEMKI